jgi:hypothetical protein
VQKKEVFEGGSLSVGNVLRNHSLLCIVLSVRA